MPIPFDRIDSHIGITAAVCQSETFRPRILHVVPTLVIRISRSAAAKTQSYKHQIDNRFFHILLPYTTSLDCWKSQTICQTHYYEVNQLTTKRGASKLLEFRDLAFAISEFEKQTVS
jgi:hypothetical protein